MRPNKSGAPRPPAFVHRSTSSTKADQQWPAVTPGSTPAPAPHSAAQTGTTLPEETAHVRASFAPPVPLTRPPATASGQLANGISTLSLNGTHQPGVAPQPGSAQQLDKARLPGSPQQPGHPHFPSQAQYPGTPKTGQPSVRPPVGGGKYVQQQQHQQPPPQLQPLGPSPPQARPGFPPGRPAGPPAFGKAAAGAQHSRPASGALQPASHRLLCVALLLLNQAHDAHSFQLAWYKTAACWVINTRVSRPVSTQGNSLLLITYLFAKALLCDA